MKDYECYHAICQYSSDGCSGCKHEMDCYNHFLNHMLRGKIMDKFEAVDKFKNELMDKFLSLCNYNDYSKINLLTIGETVDRIYEKCIDEMVNDDEKCKV